MPARQTAPDAAVQPRSAPPAMPIAATPIAATPPGDARWLSDAEQRTWRGFLAATRGIDAALGVAMQATSGLSMPDYEVLVVLSETPGEALRVMALAETLGWERSRLSHHLTRMEKRDLVRRRACPEDARGQRIELTDAGRDRIRDAAPGHVAAVRRYFFEPLDADDLAALDRISRHLAGGLPQPPRGDAQP